MNLHNALMTRRTFHHYQPGAVPQEVVDRALEAAHQAPCHKHTWPWRFTMAGPQARQALVPLGIALKEKKKTLNDTARMAITAKLSNPDRLVVVSVVRTDNAFQAREDYAAASCAIQNMHLSVHADGYGAKWSSGGITSHAKTYEILGIDPQIEEIIGFVWIGVPGNDPPKVARPGLETVVRQTD